MYSEQIEKLIELALVDGELTEKKKQILLKRAEAEGIDLDEFEMVLDARVFEKSNHQANIVQSSVVGTSKVEISKQTQILSPIRQLIKQLDDVEEKMNVQFQSELDKRRQERGKLNVKNVVGAVKDFIPGSSLFSLGKELLGEGDLSNEQKDEELRIVYETKAVEKKKDIISNSILPVSKEDVLEYLSISVLNSTNKVNQENGLADAWKKKSNIIISKANQSFSSDNDVLFELEKYNKELNSMKNTVIGGFRKFFK